jgi:hypothetical protein
VLAKKVGGTLLINSPCSVPHRSPDASPRPLLRYRPCPPATSHPSSPSSVVPSAAAAAAAAAPHCLRRPSHGYRPPPAEDRARLVPEPLPRSSLIAGPQPDLVTNIGDTPRRRSRSPYPLRGWSTSAALFGWRARLNPEMWHPLPLARRRVSDAILLPIIP